MTQATITPAGHVFFPSWAKKLTKAGTEIVSDPGPKMRHDPDQKLTEARAKSCDRCWPKAEPWAGLQMHVEGEHCQSNGTPPGTPGLGGRQHCLAKACLLP